MINNILNVFSVVFLSGEFSDEGKNTKQYIVFLEVVFLLIKQYDVSLCFKNHNAVQLDINSFMVQ